MAKVIDIKNPTLEVSSDTVVALDTNILLWTFYSRVYVTKTYQKNVYPKFVAKLIENNNKILVMGHNLNEMAHVIEKNEYNIYKENYNSSISLKEFRKNIKLRDFIKNEISLIIKQLKQIPNLILESSTSSIQDLDNFVDSYLIHNCDFFDFSLIQFCNKNNYAILTDDKDFNNDYMKTVFYTANNSVIKNI